MKFIIDRIEGEYAILELSEGQFEALPKAFVPQAKEGDSVEITVSKGSSSFLSDDFFTN